MSILREITAEKHKTVEELPFIQYLLKGEINETHYVIYLHEMMHIYRAIEEHASNIGLLDGMEGIKRSAAIYQDLQELHPNYESQLLPSTMVYLNHLKRLSESKSNKLLFAHVYVRHLGDLYGGKLISRNVPGSGKWYEFEDRPTLVKEFNSRLSLELADEANTAFDFFESIFKDLWVITEGK
jgi:heme oxygenase